MVPFTVSPRITQRGRGNPGWLFANEHTICSSDLWTHVECVLSLLWIRIGPSTKKSLGSGSSPRITPLYNFFYSDSPWLKIVDPDPDLHIFALWIQNPKIKITSLPRTILSSEVWRGVLYVTDADPDPDSDPNLKEKEESNKMTSLLRFFSEIHANTCKEVFCMPNLWIRIRSSKTK